MDVWIVSACAPVFQKLAWSPVQKLHQKQRLIDEINQEENVNQ